MASFTVTCPKSSVLLRSSRVTHNGYHKQNRFLRFQRSGQRHTSTLRVHALLNEVAIEKSSNSAPLLEANSEIKSSGDKEKLGIPDASSIAAFMTQVADLVELVDSRDIVELQLKQTECEVLIRKKEALPQPPVAAPVVLMPSPSPPAMLPPQLPPPQASSPPSAGTPAAAPEASSPAKPSTSSHPPLKCPMAGTFYRSPAPGAPPFVKVGDKIQKGQVVCIIEAMKLMNEIEADQSGTVVEILVDDGKPVSVDIPLFVVEP